MSRAGVMYRMSFELLILIQCGDEPLKVLSWVMFECCIVVVLVVVVVVLVVVCE